MAGRIFAVIWTLYGLVITSLLVGNLTSALTASVAFSITEVDLYQAKVSGPKVISVFMKTDFHRKSLYCDVCD